jgi:uncharacterized membrane protein (Fun14 family)
MSDLGARILSFVLPVLPGLIIGFFLGRLARKAFGTALLIAGGLVAVMLLVGYFGGDVSVVGDFLKTASSWAGEQLTGIKQYLAAMLPTAAAIGIGFKLGLGRG